MFNKRHLCDDYRILFFLYFSKKFKFKLIYERSIFTLE